MFDNVACAHLSLTLPGWLLRLCLSRSMCACTQWLLCCALAHKASSSETRCSSLPIVVVVVAFAQRDMKMPCACARGLVVDIRCRHCHSCCHCCRRATRRECKALLTTLLSPSPLFLSLLPLCNAMCCHVLAHKALLPSPPCNATCCRALAHKAWLPLLPCDVTCCCALAHRALSPLPPCNATCCRALVHKAWSLLPPCDATCYHALAHKALLTSPLRDAMCQQLVRSCTLLLQYEARAHAHEGLLVDII
jgi:hypothetical protein